MPLLPPEESLAALRLEGAELARRAEGGLDAPVRSCPEWNVWDVVEHTGSVHRWVTAIVASGERPRRRDLPGGPPGDAVVGWYREGLDTLVAALAAGDPGREVWTFAVTSPPTVAWWIRRMAQETAMHRWDAEAATADPGGSGPAAGFAPAFAADGIAEHLVDFLPDAGRGDLAGLTGTLHLHATDTDCEWLVDLGTRAARPEHAKAGTALRGPASDLLLWLWNRQPAAGHLEVLGDAAAAERWAQVRI